MDFSSDSVVFIIIIIHVKNGICCFFLKDLLYRRGRALVDYENANKALDKARAKNKDVLQAETSQQVCCQKFEKITESAKQGTLSTFFTYIFFTVLAKFLLEKLIFAKNLFLFLFKNCKKRNTQ